MYIQYWESAYRLFFHSHILFFLSALYFIFSQFQWWPHPKIIRIAYFKHKLAALTSASELFLILRFGTQSNKSTRKKYIYVRCTACVIFDLPPKPNRRFSDFLFAIAFLLLWTELHTYFFSLLTVSNITNCKRHQCFCLRQMVGRMKKRGWRKNSPTCTGPKKALKRGEKWKLERPNE